MLADSVAGALDMPIHVIEAGTEVQLLDLSKCGDLAAGAWQAPYCLHWGHKGPNQTWDAILEAAAQVPRIMKWE